MNDAIPRQHRDLPYPVESQLRQGRAEEPLSGTPQLLACGPQRRLPGCRSGQLRQEAGIDSAFILYAAGDPTSLGQAKTFRGAAEKLGIGIQGFRAWDPDSRNYKRLMVTAHERFSDAILLAGLTEQNGARLIKDKVSLLGQTAAQSNCWLPEQEVDGPVELFALRGPSCKRRPRRDRRGSRPHRHDRRRALDLGQGRHHRQLRDPPQRRSERRPDHRLGREEDLRAVPGT